MNDLTPFTISPTFTRKQARQIAAIAEAEIERRKKRPDLYGRESIMHLWDIDYAALGVIDGLEGAADELDALLAEWADTDPYTFVLVPDLGKPFPFGEAA